MAVDEESKCEPSAPLTQMTQMVRKERGSKHSNFTFIKVRVYNHVSGLIYWLSCLEASEFYASENICAKWLNKPVLVCI